MRSRSTPSPRWCTIALPFFTALLFAGCEQPATAPSPSLAPPSALLQRVTILDDAPREQRPLDEILSALSDPRRSNGSLIVGLKEPLAKRGVSRRGDQLSVATRLAAENAFRATFPDVPIEIGIKRIVPRREARGLSLHTMYSTAIVVRAQWNEQLLRAMRNTPVVDYIEPNYYGAFAGAVPTRVGVPATHHAMALMSAARAWGIDSVRAPDVWASYTGSGVTVNVVDSGADLYWDPATGGHPNLQFNVGFNNYAALESDNACPNDNSLSCYWEGVYHGTGVIGTLMGTDNSTGAIGTAPSPNGGANIANVFYRRTSGDSAVTEADFASAVSDLSSFNGGGGMRSPIGVTSVMFPDTTQSRFQLLSDAFVTATYFDHVLWFAAANNNRPGDPLGTFVYVPARFDAVLAVGSVYPNNGHLVRAGISPVDPKLDLVAPGTNLVIPWNRADGGPAKIETGNSFAAPIAAGVGRLGMEAHPEWTSEDLRYWILETARKVGNAKQEEYGQGMPDAVCLIYETTLCRPFSVNITGPQSIYYAGTWQWTANIVNGTGYADTYRWEMSYNGTSWSAVGTNSATYSASFSGSTNITFWLRVTVSLGDEWHTSAPYQVHVQLCGSGASVAGASSGSNATSSGTATSPMFIC